MVILKCKMMENLGFVCKNCKYAYDMLIDDMYPIWVIHNRCLMIGLYDRCPHRATYSEAELEAECVIYLISDCCALTLIKWL